MRNKKKVSPLLIIIPIIVVVLVAVVIILLSTRNKKDPNSAQNGGKPNSEEQQNGEATEETDILKFVDAKRNHFEVEIDPEVEKHPYVPSSFSNDKKTCSYEDDQYTSRRGIDVSSHQGKIDWQAVADSGIEFVFIRIGFRGYGTGKIVKDDRFEANIKGAKNAGLDVGVYFFSQAVDEKEARAEAKRCLKWLKDYELDLPVVFDAEHIQDDKARTDDVTGEQFTKNAAAFCKRIRNKSDYDTAIYSNMYWEAFIYDLKEIPDYPIWYADYERLPQTPYHFTWWQYSEKGTVSGISGKVDLDIEIIKK